MGRRLPVVFLAIGAAALATAAGAAGAPAAQPQAVELYRSPADYAKAGDFSFSYPSELVVLQDFVYADAQAGGALHTVVLRHKDAETGDLRSIEINMLRSMKRKLTCADYSACRVVDGVVIGTNSEDPDLLRALDQVAKSFKRR